MQSLTPIHAYCQHCGTHKRTFNEQCPKCGKFPTKDHIFRQAAQLVIDTANSPATRSTYASSLKLFAEWWTANNQPNFNRAAVQAFKSSLLAQYSPATVNLRLAVLRKLAKELQFAGVMTRDDSEAIQDITLVNNAGVRAGMWLTKEQCEKLLALPNIKRPRGLRDRAILALFLGCGLRRAELCSLTWGHIQERDGRWAIVDLVGKGNRRRTVAVPNWTKAALDTYKASTNSQDSAEAVFRLIGENGKTGSLDPGQIRQMVKRYGLKLGVKLAPHDLRRTCAKLCRKNGGEIEQISLLLGHSSVQTTERYLGTKQDLTNPPNDLIRLNLET